MKNKTTATKLISLLTTAFFALASATLAVSPPPDGGYPGQNTAEGEDALFSLTTGINNTAIGYHALFADTTGTGETAVGYQALARSNGPGARLNTGVGEFALSLNTYGTNNTAVGAQALQANTTGSNNVAIGTAASAGNTTGGNNIAIGAYVLGSSTSNLNIAIGTNSMDSHRTGDGNVAVGHFAMFSNFVGSSNVAVGNNALPGNGGSNNVALGYSALSRSSVGSKNIAVGYQAGMAIEQGSNNICIGDVGVGSDENTTRIGNVRTTNTYIAGISGSTVPAGVGVLIDSSGHLGTNTSSARYKEQIKPMENASEAILSLKPATFRYKKEFDPDAIPQFGLVAEEVAKVNPDLVMRDDEGKPYTVRYEAVNAMLLNEFLKEHRKVEEQDSINRQQQASIAQLAATVKKQAAQLREVNARLATLQLSSRIARNQ